MADYTTWLSQLPLKPTKTGARLDLRLYIYPDGHGNVIHGTDANQPVNDVEEAVAVVRAVWARAQGQDGQG